MANKDRVPERGSVDDAARGRRILSTAFVRVGPDNLLTVGLRDGRELVLRDVRMLPDRFCGAEVAGSGATKTCASYADVVAARPGGASTESPTSDLAAPNPLPSAKPRAK